MTLRVGHEKRWIVGRQRWIFPLGKHGSPALICMGGERMDHRRDVTGNMRIKERLAVVLQTRGATSTVLSCGVSSKHSEGSIEQLIVWYSWHYGGLRSGNHTWLRLMAGRVQCTLPAVLLLSGIVTGDPW